MPGFEQEVPSLVLPSRFEAFTAPEALASSDAFASSGAAAVPATATGPVVASSSAPSTLLLCVCESIQMVKREVVPVLKGAGYEVDLVEASTRRPLPLSGKPYRLLLFDVGSKSDNGYQICAQTRLASELPIMLMLRGAARNEVVRGFQAGADAYVLVPFDPRELLVRLDALLRRSPAPSVNQ